MESVAYTDVTPEWAHGHVKPDECSVVVCAESETMGPMYAVIDHSLQSTLAYASTTQGCYQFLNTLDGRICPTCGARRMWDGGGYWCPPCQEEAEIEEGVWK